MKSLRERRKEAERKIMDARSAYSCEGFGFNEKIGWGFLFLLLLIDKKEVEGPQAFSIGVEVRQFSYELVVYRLLDDGETEFAHVQEGSTPWVTGSVINYIPINSEFTQIGDKIMWKHNSAGKETEKDVSNIFERNPFRFSV
ncbi:MAG: hypothetical protein WCW16_02540 [Candidatus Magasanikbacteria bacterium]